MFILYNNLLCLKFNEAVRKADENLFGMGVHVLTSSIIVRSRTGRKNMKFEGEKYLCKSRFFGLSITTYIRIRDVPYGL